MGQRLVAADSFGWCRTTSCGIFRLQSIEVSYDVRLITHNMSLRVERSYRKVLGLLPGLSQ